ncbi:hypothetical protein AYI70_g132 [Smittium culicis]|uniref:Uncharacterized protein n=1 Tax=Smittium culicis TaxID=133412 RepID=A0A1R1YHT7_9FUNG|nr:hypothetical protein AYI70_g132 [Smittium culicis]
MFTPERRKRSQEGSDAYDESLDRTRVDIARAKNYEPPHQNPNMHLANDKKESISTLDSSDSDSVSIETQNTKYTPSKPYISSIRSAINQQQRLENISDISQTLTDHSNIAEPHHDGHYQDNCDIKPSYETYSILHNAQETSIDYSPTPGTYKKLKIDGENSDTSNVNLDQQRSSGIRNRLPNICAILSSRNSSMNSSNDESGELGGDVLGKTNSIDTAEMQLLQVMKVADPKKSPHSIRLIVICGDQTKVVDCEVLKSCTIGQIFYAHYPDAPQKLIFRDVSSKVILNPASSIGDQVSDSQRSLTISATVPSAVAHVPSWILNSVSMGDTGTRNNKNDKNNYCRDIVTKYGKERGSGNNRKSDEESLALEEEEASSALMMINRGLKLDKF